MECRGCTIIKLPSEFPPCTISDECEHAPLFCLRCTIAHVEKTLSCPHPGCTQTVKENEKKLELLRAMLDTMFKEYEECSSIEQDVSEKPSVTSTSAEEVITVSSLTGESMRVEYNPSLTVIDLKRKIETKTKHAIEKQKLLYNNLELKNYKEQKMSCLSDFDIKPKTTLFLVIRLYTIPGSFDEVVFDLYWGYPKSWFKRFTRGFLDASCFLYDDECVKFLCDFREPNPIAGVVGHSGDIMDDEKRVGHQTIQVSLKSIPDYIQNIFFSLSAWDTENISAFSSLSLRFYKKDDPSNDLCKTTFVDTYISQALLMCCVSRNDDGNWEIFQLGKPCNGNAKYYDPIYRQISKLLRDGLVCKRKP